MNQKIKVLISLIVLLTAVAFAAPAIQEVNTLMSLSWDAGNPAADLAGFNVYVANTNIPTRQVFTATNRIELTNVLFQLPNGVYQLYVTALGKSGLESDPSDSLFVFWYGQKPGAPTNLVVQFTRNP
jgi:hypothetical protein